MQYFSQGSNYYRTSVGFPWLYDRVAAMQFNLLTFLGLREHHFLLDIGCGSLRGGRILIPYLLSGRYFGLEPEQHLIDEGIKKELGKDMINMKKPSFTNDNNFTLSTFNQKFNFIIAHSIFTHATEKQIIRCLSEAKKVMAQNCLFASTFYSGKNNYEGDKWIYPGFVTYTFEHMTTLVEREGLICKLIDWPHPSHQRWIVITHPENEKNIPDVSNITNLLHLEKELRYYRKLPYIRFRSKIGLFIEQIVLQIHERINKWRQ